MSRRNIYKKASTQPSQAIVDHVESHFDPNALIHVIETADFSDYATRTDVGGGWDRFYWYKDNGSDILAVAHLDHVQEDYRAQVIDTAAGPLVVSGALDDRLGAYVILELLPAMGLNFDILLTTDEEIARSTAVDFAADFCSGGDGEPTKQYNWLIEFDRGGTDVVMYDYETGEYAAMVEAAGAQVGQGSYSDIADLEELRCAGFNWGVGYQDYHSARSHAWLADTFKSVARFLKFYSANYDTHLPHEPGSYSRWMTGSGKGWWETYRDEDFDDFEPQKDLVDPDDFDSSDPPTHIDFEPFEADCGHIVNLCDDASYVDRPGGFCVCRVCDEAEFGGSGSAA